MSQDNSAAGGSPAFELKGTVSTLTVIRLRTAQLDSIRTELSDKVGQVARFFHHAPVVIDLEALGEAANDLSYAAVVALLREANLVPVAVRNCKPSRELEAVTAGLGLLKGGGALIEPQGAAAATAGGDEEPPASGEARSDEEEASTALLGSVGMLVTQPARAGQVVYAQGRDLVMVAPVNAGAEVIADGNIHVYGPLRGRALAGAHGDEGARIFCASLEAELVSVAGHYLRADEIPEACSGRSVQIHLADGEVVVKAF
jgi:septum site-determining protein MinC